MSAARVPKRVLTTVLVVALVSMIPGLAAPAATDLTGAAASEQSTAAATEPASTVASPSITIAVQADGSADWTIVNTVALDSDTARSTFDDLATNETYKQRVLRDTVWAYRALANGTSQTLDREMTVEAQAIELRREGSTGVIAVSFEWTGFASTDGDRVVVGDVFGSGYPVEADRTLTITAPEGYGLESHGVSADATVTDDRTVTWDGPVVVDSSIELTYAEGLPTSTPPATRTAETTASPTATESATSAGSDEGTEADGDTSTGTESSGSDGFAVPVALAALAVAVVLARRDRTE